MYMPLIYLPFVVALIWLGYKLYGFAMKKHQPKVSYSVSTLGKTISVINHTVGLIFAMPGLLILGLYFYIYFFAPSNQISSFELKGSVFEKAIKYVNEFQKSNKRLPHGGEFLDWEKEMLRLGEDEMGLSYLLPPYPSDVLIKFGEPPKNSFLIGYWTGDVHSYYIPWSSENDVAYILDREYYIMGSAFKDFILFLSYASIFLVPSFCLVADSFASKPKKCL